MVDNYYPLLNNGESNDELEDVNCPACYPVCNEIRYEIFTDVKTDILTSQNNLTHLDIFYKSSGILQYLQVVSFGPIDLLGNID